MWVMVRVLIATLLQNRWCEVGDEIALDHKRAKFLAEKKPPIVKIISEPSGDPFPEPPKLKANRRREPQSNAKLTDKDPPDNPPTVDNDDPGSDDDAVDFEDIGIAGRTAELLRGGGLITIDQVQDAIAEDPEQLSQLTAINGIGQNTAVSIAAAVNAHVESDAE